ncbi:MAG TPA: GAF domain-containing protein, partial [Bryobacteraceae bacterium]
LVTHDNRILDIADRLMVLKDGRLGSFGAAMSPHAGHLLTALSRMPSRLQLDTLVGRMRDGEFLDLLKGMGAEFEQFLNVLEMGGQDSVRELFPNLLGMALGKLAGLLDADGAGLFVLRRGRLEAAMDAGPHDETRLDLARRAAERGEVLNLSGTDLGAGTRTVLCVPLRNRHDEIRGVAQFVNKRGGEFTVADERAFRDFAAPLALILEGCERVGH